MCGNNGSISRHLSSVRSAHRRCKNRIKGRPKGKCNGSPAGGTDVSRAGMKSEAGEKTGAGMKDEAGERIKASRYHTGLWIGD